MFKSITRILLLSAVVFSGGVFAGEGETVNLKLDDVSKPECMISKCDLGEGRRPVTIAETGGVCPKGKVSLKNLNDTQSFNLLGASFNLAGGKDPELSYGDKKQKLKFKDGSLGVAKASLGGATGIVAFPVVLRDARSGAMTVYYRPGGVMKFKVGGKDVSLYDDNGDGKWSLAEDTFTFDKGFAYAPVTANIGTAKGLFALKDLAADANSISVAEIGSSAKVGVKWSGAKADVTLAFASADTTFFSMGKGMSSVVAEGEYKLVYGLVYEKKLKKCIAAVMPGESQPITVKAGIVNKEEYGKSFRLAFTPEIKGRKVSISPYDFRLFGKAGEEYVAFSFKYKSTPNVSVKVGKKSYPMGSFEFG